MIDKLMLTKSCCTNRAPEQNLQAFVAYHDFWLERSMTWSLPPKTDNNSPGRRRRRNCRELRLGTVTKAWNGPPSAWRCTLADFRAFDWLPCRNPKQLGVYPSHDSSVLLISWGKGNRTPSSVCTQVSLLANHCAQGSRQTFYNNEPQVKCKSSKLQTWTWWGNCYFTVKVDWGDRETLLLSGHSWVPTIYCEWPAAWWHSNGKSIEFKIVRTQEEKAKVSMGALKS